MMKSLKVATLIAVMVGMGAAAYAAQNPSAEYGKKLFNDPTLGGATASKSCNNCHPSGKGVENAWKNPKLGEQINTCITGALKGKALPMESVQMRSLIMYLQSLKPASIK
ncbi:MAG: cytochrome C [Chlorobaculum sp.]|nr:cytochrome C [Chlorobaculum sp.]